MKKPRHLLSLSKVADESVPMAEGPERRAFRDGAIYVATGLVMLLAGLSRWSWRAEDGVLIWHVSDDAMITSRVARMVHEIGTPYYNAGEAVATSTSLVWPVLLSPVFAVADGESAILVFIILGVVLSVAAAMVAGRVFPPGGWRIAVFLAVCLSPQMLYYGANSWEHIPQALLVTLGLGKILSASREKGALSVPTSAFVLICCAFLFRPDAAPLIAVVGATWFLAGGRYRAPATYGVAAAMLLIPIGYFGAMLSIFGDAVPNTAHLKVLSAAESVRHGLSYVFDPRLSGYVPMLLVGTTVLTLLVRPGVPGVPLVLAALWAQLLYVVAVGGDVFGYGRFLVIILPGLVVTFALVLRAVTERRGLQGRPVFVCLILLCLVAAGSLTLLRGDLQAALKPKERAIFPIQQHLRLMAAIEEALVPDEGSVGLHYLGVGYHLPEFHIVDFLGKAEPVIARTDPRPGPIGHNKWDYEYAMDAYDIAALPMLSGTFARTSAPDYVRDPKRQRLFWEDAVREGLSRGYIFLPPRVFGNPEPGIGLMVRADLADRFAE